MGVSIFSLERPLTTWDLLYKLDLQKYSVGIIYH
jgi:hypothetical protein